MVTNHWVTAGELEFHYREAGTGAPIVFLHALGRDASDWDTVIPGLSGSYRCIALDQRGHGSSSRPSEYSFELMRDDLLHFVGELGLDRFTLVGHSMGGTVAWLFAEDHVVRLERLVVEDTAPPSARRSYPEPSEVPPEPVAYDWRARLALVAQLNNPDPSWWERLPLVTAPTLLIAGSREDEDLAEVNGLLPTCSLVTIDAGHWIHETRPEEYVRAIQSFLGA